MKALGSLSLLVVALLNLAWSGSDRSDWQLINCSMQVCTCCQQELVWEGVAALPWQLREDQAGNSTCCVAAAAWESRNGCSLSWGEKGGGQDPASGQTQGISRTPPQQPGFCPGDDDVGIADWNLPVGKGLSEML